MLKSIKALVSAVLFVAATVTTATASDSFSDHVVNSTSRGLAMDGFDVVAYWADSAPAKGDATISHIYKGRKWLFSSEENRDLFAANPAKYEPQNDGWCAFAVANGYAAEVDFIDGWFITDDKLYVTWSGDVRDRFLADRDNMLANNAANWSTVREGLQQGNVKFVAHSQRPQLGFVHPQQLPDQS